MTENKNNDQNPEEIEIVEAEAAVVESTDETVDELLEKLEKSEALAKEYLDGWQRARAEFANYKKRVERDQALVQQNAVSSVIKRYLDVMDDLDRALKNRPQEGEGASWASGIELVYRKLQSILEGEGLQKIEAEGQIFDPNLHEAISHEPNDDFESGQIIEVLKQGYLLGDRVVRPALVRVAQ